MRRAYVSNNVYSSSTLRLEADLYVYVIYNGGGGQRQREMKKVSVESDRVFCGTVIKNYHLNVSI